MTGPLRLFSINLTDRFSGQDVDVVKHLAMQVGEKVRLQPVAEKMDRNKKNKFRVRQN